MSTYKLTTNFSDGSVTTANFTVPDISGNYSFTLNLSDGTSLCLGEISVSSQQQTYKLCLNLSDGTSIDCGNFTTQEIIKIMSYIICGNWKMNLTASDIEGYVDALEFLNENSTIVLFPQTCLIKPLSDALAARGPINGSTIHLGAQVCASKSSGAYTGQNSVAALSSLGVEYFMVGHSEVEAYLGTSDYAAIIALVYANGGSVLFYLNESTTIYNDGTFSEYVKERLSSVADSLVDGTFSVVYVPEWGIGTGITVTTEVVKSKFDIIYDNLREIFGNSVAKSIPILYEGATTLGNVADFLDVVAPITNTVGAVPGGLSTRPAQFNEYLNIVNEL